MAQPRYLSHAGVHHFSPTGVSDALAHAHQQHRDSPLAWGGTLLPPISEDCRARPADKQHRHTAPPSPSGHAEISTTVARKPLKLKIKFPSKQKGSESSVPTTPPTAFQQLERIAAACAKEADPIGPLPAEYYIPLPALPETVEAAPVTTLTERPASAPAAAQPCDPSAERKRRKRKSPEQPAPAEAEAAAAALLPASAHSTGDAAWHNSAQAARPATAPAVSGQKTLRAEPDAPAASPPAAVQALPAAASEPHGSLQQAAVLQQSPEQSFMGALMHGDREPMHDDKQTNDQAPDAAPHVADPQQQQQQQALCPDSQQPAKQQHLSGHKRAPSAEPDLQPEPCKLRPAKRHKMPAATAAPDRKPVMPPLPEALPDEADRQSTLPSAQQQHLQPQQQGDQAHQKALGLDEQVDHVAAAPPAKRVKTAEAACQTDAPPEPPVQPAVLSMPRSEGTNLETMLELIGALSGSDIVGNRTVEQFSGHARHFKKQGDSLKEMQQPDQQQSIMIAYAKAGVSFLLQSFALEQRLTDNRIKRQQVVAMYESTAAWLESTARQAARTDEPVQHLARLLITRMGAVAQLRATWLARTALQDDCRQVEAPPSRRPSPLGGLSNPPSPPLPTPAGTPVLQQQQQQQQRQASWGSGNGSAGAVRRSTTPVPAAPKAGGKGQLQGPAPTAGSPGSNNSTNSATSAHGLAPHPTGQAGKAPELPHAAAMQLAGSMRRMLKASETLKVSSSEMAVLSRETECGHVKQALSLLALMALDGLGGELKMTLACSSRALESICKLQNAGT